MATGATTPLCVDGSLGANRATDPLDAARSAGCLLSLPSRCASGHRKPGGANVATQGVLQSQEAESANENLPECQFQVLACQRALCRRYTETSHPMIKQIVRLENQRATGMVFPIACPHEDLLFSSFGTKLRALPVFPNYITALARAEDEEPKLVETGAGDDKVIMLQYMRKYWHWRRSLRNIFGWRPFVSSTKPITSTCLTVRCIWSSAK